MNAPVMVAALAGSLGGTLLAAAAWSVGKRAFEKAWGVSEGMLMFIEGLLAPLRRAERVGDRASSRDRRRLAVAAAIAGLALGLLLAGPIVSVMVAIVAGTVVPRTVGWRARRYREEVDRSAAALARALAGALAAGRSVRSSFGVAARELQGSAGRELTAVAAALELGEPTEYALEFLRARAHSRRIDLIAAAIGLQRRAGGDLATLLRSIAATIEESDRLRDEARAASAQARFTSAIVLAMPAVVALLGELAAPGTAARIVESPIGLWMLVVALGMQLAGAAMVRRISRVRL